MVQTLFRIGKSSASAVDRPAAIYIAVYIARLRTSAHSLSSSSGTTTTRGPRTLARQFDRYIDYAHLLALPDRYGQRTLARQSEHIRAVLATHTCSSIRDLRRPLTIARVGRVVLQRLRTLCATSVIMRGDPSLDPVDRLPHNQLKRRRWRPRKRPKGFDEDGNPKLCGPRMIWPITEHEQEDSPDAELEWKLVALRRSEKHWAPLKIVQTSHAMVFTEVQTTPVQSLEPHYLADSCLSMSYDGFPDAAGSSSTPTTTSPTHSIPQPLLSERVAQQVPCGV